MKQKQALEILKKGKNVFLTGAAGSGKTYLLNEFLTFLCAKNINAAVTASTGIAATHLGGFTIHSWAGIGINRNLNVTQIKALKRKKHLRDRYLKTKVLVIDEVSMLNAYTLDLVDKVCRGFLNNDLAFGGMQVVLTGDLFQLPPVSDGKDGGGFINEAKVWKKLDLNICYLSEQHRQEDGVFTGVLNDIRDNNVTERTKKLLMSRYMKDVPAYVYPTRLYTHNVDVDSINNEELRIIGGGARGYNMVSVGAEALVMALKKSCLAHERLVLKKKAKVMFVKNNYVEGYVNGTLGEVVDFENGFPIVETAGWRKIVVRPEEWKIEEDGEVKARIKQIPLRLAWAITIHKSQGMSLDAAVIDLSKSFVRGMGYVALSRVRTLNGIRLVGINDDALKVSDEVLEFDKKLRKMSIA